MGRQDALKALDRTKGMMISSGDKAVSQIVELDHAMDQLASGNFVLGEYHFTMALYADSQERLSQHIAATRAELVQCRLRLDQGGLGGCRRRSIRSCRETGSIAPDWQTSVR